MRIVTFLILFSCFTAQAQKKIALTFDDLPSASPQISLAHTQKLNNKLLATLQAHQLQATGFVNEAEVDVKGEKMERLAILKQWIDNGHTLGNHTYSHRNYHKVGFERYKEDILKGEVLTKTLLQEEGLALTYFRPPFLRTGASRAAKDQLENLLQEKGYTMVPATVESADHLFNLLYLQAKVAQDSAGMRSVTQDYLTYVTTQLEHYEQLAETVFHTAIPQIYLCHANDLNADNLNSLILLLKKKDYEIIPLEEAMRHPVFQQPDPYVGEKGLTWIERFATTDSTNKEFKKKPGVPVETRAAYEKAVDKQFWFLLRPRIEAMELINLNTGILFLVTLICLMMFIKHKSYK